MGLRKILRAKGIPTPPQGHWNRVHAGRTVPDPPEAEPRAPGESGRVALDPRFEGLMPAAEPMPAGGPFASAAVPENLDELRARELAALGSVRVPRTLERAHSGLARLLRQEAEKRRKAETDRWSWREPAFDTPLGQRQLRLVNALYLALERRGHAGSAWEREGLLEARCTVGDQQVGFSFAVVGKHRTERIGGYQRPARDLPASTPLALSLGQTFRTDIEVTWQDGDAGKLESRLGEVAAGVIVAGEAAFRQGLVEAAEWREQQRQWEEERLRKRAAELDAKRLEDLVTSGRLLAQAEEIRALVERVRDAVLAGQTTIAREELAAWVEWASAYADRVDPVRSGQVLTHIKDFERE